MFKNFAISPKDLIIVAAGAFIVYLLFFQQKGERSTVTETQSETVDNVRESATGFNLQLPELQPAIIYRDRIVEVEGRQDVAPIDLDKLKVLNRYKDTARLANATVYSEILTDGTVYSNKITADIQVKTITKTIEKETVRFSSALYISPEINFMPGVNFLQSAGASLNYINKTDFGVGLGINYNFNSQSMVYGLRLHKKLF